MGIYNNTDTFANGTTYDVVAAEGYMPSFGGQLIMIESAINEEKLFSAIIKNDFKEAVQARNGEAVNESVEVVTEGVSEFGTKIKEMIMKAWEKIKGLFKAFLSKLNSVVMRDTKALFKKYSKEFWTHSGKLKKWKFAKRQKEFFTTDAAKLASTFSTEMGNITSMTYGADKLKTKNEEISDGTFLEKQLTALLGTSTDRKSFAKDLHEYYFSDEETHTDEEVPKDIKNEISDVMNNNKLISETKKLQTNVDKYFTTLLKNIDNVVKEIGNKIVEDKGEDKAQTVSLKYGDEDKNETKITNKSSLLMKKLNCIRSIATNYQTAINMMVNGTLHETKWHIAQCRRVFSQIVSARSAKNEAVLLDAIGESAEYEVYDSFDNYEFE